MRHIVLDTETTGLDVNTQRVIELGCIELINKIPTNRSIHFFLNVGNLVIQRGATEVHGIVSSMLVNQPTFSEIAQEFLDFIGNDPIVIHNAPFDVKFLRKELALCNRPMFTNPIIDTLEIARKIFPGKRCNLDALCKRLKINNEARFVHGHGALLDSKLLAKVFYLLDYVESSESKIDFQEPQNLPIMVETKVNFIQRDLLYKISEEEKNLHNKVMTRLQKK